MVVARPASAGHTVPAGQLAVLAEGSWWVLVLLAECWWWCECSDEVQSEAVTIIQPVSEQHHSQHHHHHYLNIQV